MREVVTKIWRNSICYLSRWYISINTFSGTALAIFGTWSQLPKMHIFGYRPNDQVFFWGIIVPSIISTIIGKIRSQAAVYKIDNIAKKNKEEIKYF